MAMSPSFIRMRGIVKRYGGLPALDGVDMEVRAGEAHALVGENGAGKSTLVRVLAGLTTPTAGEVEVAGCPLPPGDPQAALARGIVVVQQHFALVPALTVAENVVLGAEPRRGPFLDRRRIAGEVEALIARLGVPLRPCDRVEGLTVGQRQAVEILKALYRRVRCLVLDEPTSALSPVEARRLFEAVRRLRAEGVALLLVTHRLREVFAHADRATVLRRGRVAGRFDVRDVTEADLARAVVGEGTVADVRVERTAGVGEVLLKAQDLSATDERGAPVLNGLSLVLRRGEVAGVAGVAGNGQAELARALAGRLPVTSGQVLFLGEPVTGRALAARLGLSCIPEDRDAEGLVLPFSLTENAILGDHREASFLMGFNTKRRFTTEGTEKDRRQETGDRRKTYGFGSLLTPVFCILYSVFCRLPSPWSLWSLWFRFFKVFNREDIRSHAEALIRRFDVRAQGVESPAESLSGGNRQKLVVGRELGRNPHLVIAAQPTRGLDIRAAAFVHGQLIAARDRGAGVLLISQDLEEILRLSDRVLVMVRGRIVADLPRDEADEERLGKLMMRSE